MGYDINGICTKDWGRMRFFEVLSVGDLRVSSALGDDAQAVIFEVAEAIRTPLNEFHLAVESLGDPVVAGEAPHAGDRFDPVIEGGAERQRVGFERRASSREQFF